MRVVAVYKSETDYARDVEDFLRDFESQTGHQLETIDPDAPAGIDFCNAYGIMEYPTLIAIADDGSMQNMWSGLPLPTVMEISFYA
jgi:hypothetical protein